MNRVVKILKNAKIFYFSTIDGDQPQVRPYNVVMEYNDKTYFYTNNHTHAYKQMLQNPKIELCASIDEDRWLRVNGKVVFDYDAKVKEKMLEENPTLKKMYSADDKIFEVFYLSNMSAKIHSTHSEPEVIC